MAKAVTSRMDIDLARTFLTIVRTRSFIRAADLLNISQTTVSARVRSLESQLGGILFLRGKNGASLTPAGERFLKFAPTFVQLWERARHQVAGSSSGRRTLAIGGETSLWYPWVLEWLHWMRASAPDIGLKVQVGFPDPLLDQVAAGVLDVAVMYAPQHRSGLRVELLVEDKLVLVTSAAADDPPTTDGYVHVEWGQTLNEFDVPECLDDSSPRLSVGLGPLALNYILEAGGSGYFRQSVITPFLSSGKLRLVAGASSFSYPVYAVSSTQTDDELIDIALAGLRSVSTSGFVRPRHYPVI